MATTGSGTRTSRSPLLACSTGSMWICTSSISPPASLPFGPLRPVHRDAAMRHHRRDAAGRARRSLVPDPEIPCEQCSQSGDAFLAVAEAAAGSPKSLRCVIVKVEFNAAAPCPVPVKQEMIAWWGPTILNISAAANRRRSTLSPRKSGLLIPVNRKMRLGKPTPVTKTASRCRWRNRRY